MALKLMYITNRPDIAQIAESAGVDRVFVDLEYIGKSLRQAGMDTVKSRHTLEDVKKIKNSITKAELLVRCNPIHYESAEYISSEKEINSIIENGADIIMLPYFKTTEEVKTFLAMVDGRARTMLLFETPEAIERIEDILNIKGIDEVFIGLNDLSLGYKKKFMFELLADGTVENACIKFRNKNLPYGFGGVASVGAGTLPSEKIIKEHYRLESTSVILSRSFCNIDKISHMGVISSTFVNGIREIRKVEAECMKYIDFFKRNEQEVKNIVHSIVGE